MHAGFLDTWSRLDSPIHHAPATLKLGVTLALVVAIVVLPLRLTGVLAGLAAIIVVAALMSRVPPGFILKRLLLLEPLVGGVAILSVFQPGGRLIAASIVVKSTLCLLAMIVLTNTTPFSALLDVLRRMRVPALLVTVLALMYRYLFVLVEEAGRMQRARASRTFTRGRSHVWRSLASLVGQLFVRSTERAERIYAAMCARGWQ